MIETEIRTINQFGSRRLVIRFPSAGEPTRTIVVLGGTLGTLFHDAQGNVTSIEVHLPAADQGSDYWPVEQTLNAATRLWKYKISDEDIAEIRKRFPFPWKRTWDCRADSPLPDSVTCDDCDHKGTVFWSDHNDIHNPTGYNKILCRCCTLTRRIKHAEEEVARYSGLLPGLRRDLESACN